MSETYQAVFDAIRSKVSSVDIGQVVREFIRSNWDLGYLQQQAQSEIYLLVGHAKDQISEAFRKSSNPSSVYRPELSFSGNMWKASYGDCVGLGLSPEDAMEDFDYTWKKCQHVRRVEDQG